MAVDKFSPGKISILLFRPVCQQIISQGIPVISVHDIFYPYGIIPACGYLLSFQSQIFTGNNFIRQAPAFSIRNQKRGQNDRMKGNIIFSVYIIMPDFRFFIFTLFFPVQSPQLPERFRIIFQGGSAGRQISQDIFCPDIYFLILIACMRHFDSPVQISCQRPVSQPFPYISFGKGLRIFSPVFMAFHQIFQFLFHTAQGNKQMPAAPEGNFRTAYGTYGIFQTFRFEYRTACITLIAPRFTAAFRAGSSYKPIRKEGTAVFAIGLRDFFFISKRAFIQLFVEFLYKFLMLFR